MILVGNQRGGGQNLAAHLLNDENEHVEVYEVRGFVAEDLHGAFKEAQAISRATRATQYLYSLSLNPPIGAEVSTEEFENAIAKVEDTLGLTDQPRAIVFHEKEGRRHCHVVWSRIDENLKAIQLSFSKTKLQSVARDLYLEHGWELPPGLKDKRLRDPKNFTLAEWQQCKRLDLDVREVKGAIQSAWQQSDNGKAFAHALKEQGLTLAKGDRRGCVAVDIEGNLFAVARYAGIKARDVKARLGDLNTLPNVSEAKEQISHEMSDAFTRMQNELNEARTRMKAEQRKLVQRMTDQHRAERDGLKEKQAKRWQEENQARQKRYNKGWRGLWDWVSGRSGKIRQQNEAETEAAFQRDRAEKDNLIQTQLDRRGQLQDKLRKQQDPLKEAHRALMRDREEMEKRLRQQEDIAKSRTRNRGPTLER